MILEDTSAPVPPNNPWIDLVRAYSAKFPKDIDRIQSNPTEQDYAFIDSMVSNIRNAVYLWAPGIHGRPEDSLRMVTQVIHSAIELASLMGFANVLDEAFIRVHHARMQNYPPDLEPLIRRIKK